jgi:hypothetical protein
MTAETVAPNTETTEEDPMDMEIQNESAELEKNSAEVEKALQGVGGMKGLELTLQEMPEDRKTVMMKKIKEEYDVIQNRRGMKLSDAGGHIFSGKDKILHPFENMDAEGQTGINKTMYDISGITGLTALDGLVEGGWGKLSEFYHTIQKNREKRNYGKELKKLENSEA